MTEHTEDELKRLNDELKKLEKERDTYREAFRLMLRWADRNSKWGKGTSYFGRTRVSLPLRLEAHYQKSFFVLVITNQLFPRNRIMVVCPTLCNQIQFSQLSL